MIKIGDALLFLGIDKSQFDKDMKETEKHVKDSMAKIQDSLRVAGAAFTAVGAAGLKMVTDARKLNAELGQTALTLGVTTKDMRDLALATTDVTFPLKSVTATFDLLARAGIRNTAEMQASAKAFDRLADATGSSAEAVAQQLIPAFKVFGLELPRTAQDLDKFTWLTKNTTVEISEFASAMDYVAAYGRNLNLTIGDMVAIMAALEARGVTGSAVTRVFRTAISQAASGAVDLNKALGLTQKEIDRYSDAMDDAVGITDKYADVANEQYGIMDKIKQKWEELTLSVGSILAPIESLLALMSTLGIVMIALSTKTMVVMIAKIWAVVTALWAQVTATVAAIAATGYGIPIALAAVAAIGSLAFGISQLVGRQKEQAISTGDATVSTEQLLKSLSKATVATDAQAESTRQLTVARLQEAIATSQDTEEKKKLRAELEKLLSVTERYLSILGYEKGVTEEAWTPALWEFLGLPQLEKVPAGRTSAVAWEAGHLMGYQHGGLIPEPTLLYGLKSLKPYAIAGEHGTERVVSGSTGYRTANIIFQVDGRTLAQVIGQPLVDEIRLRQGLK